jgi:CDP-6-deoxy-D-xylo-4-hexulose-3-dehydrase
LFKNIIDDLPLFYDLPDREASTLALPFLPCTEEVGKRYRERLEAEGVETRNIIGGNLLRHRTFSRYGDYMRFPNAEEINNGFYIGNNQFLKEADFADLRTCLLRE